MATQIYIQCFLAGLLGILFHVVAIKLPRLKKRFKAANVEFSFKAYLKGDALALISSLVTVIIVVYLLDELAGLKPAILDYVKFLFVFVGYSGSSLLIGALGKADTYVNKIINEKTDIADEKI